MLVELCPETRTWPPSRWDGHILLHTQHMQSSTRTAHMPICGDGMVTIPVTAWTSFLTYEQHYLLEVRIIDDLAFSHARVFTTNQSWRQFQLVAIDLWLLRWRISICKVWQFPDLLAGITRRGGSSILLEWKGHVCWRLCHSFIKQKACSTASDCGCYWWKSELLIQRIAV